MAARSAGWLLALVCVSQFAAETMGPQKTAAGRRTAGGWADGD